MSAGIAGIALEHLSASSASAYGECARRWAGLYRDGLPRVVTPPLVFGTAWDLTVGRALRGRLESPVFGATHLSREGLQARWLEAWSEAVQEAEASGRLDWQGELAADLENDGRRLCALPGTSQRLKGLRLATERGEPALQRRVELRVPGVPVPVIGFLDALLEDGTVVDVKTARRPWPATKPRMDLQPRVYLAALQQEGLPLSGLRFRHLVWVRGGRPLLQVLDTEFSQVDLFVALDALRETWRGIASGVFPPNLGCWRCGPACEVYRAGRCLGRR